MAIDRFALGLFGLLVLAAGIGLITRSWRGTQDDFLGNRQPWRERTVRSALSGFGAFLAGAGVIVAASSWFWGAAWSSKGVAAILVLGLVIVVVTTLGSLWQYFLVDRFRDGLVEHFRRKRDR